MPKPDKYSNFAELKRAESSRAWRIGLRRRDSKVLIVAPHGGNIELGTSDLSARIAGDSHNLYLFEGRKKRGENQALHITSHHFDEPQALALAAKCSIVLGIHGCRGTRTIYVGGRDAELRADLAAALSITGLPIKSQGHRYRAMEPHNICNRGNRGRGAQLEITPDLRRSRYWLARIAAITRSVIEKHLAKQKTELPVTFRVRFRFKLQKKLKISEKEYRFTIAGREVVLSSQFTDTTVIEDDEWLVMNARGFESREAASEFGRRLKSAIEISSVIARLGVNTGVDLPTSGVGESIREIFKGEGVLSRDNVHGVDVFEDDPRVRFFHMRMTGTIHSAPNPFLSELPALFEISDAPSKRTLDIVLLLNYALTRPDPVAMIVFAVSAVEMLGQDEKWSIEQRTMLDAAAEAAERASVGTASERAEVADAIRRGTHKLGLRQGVLRLLSTLGLNHLKKKWDALYQERSALVHGLVPRPGVDYGDLAFRATSLAGHILLTDIGREVPSAIRHRDAYYPTP
jgi:phage replication-related protein YjqB (UPF0714/DUF867 family)